MNVAWRLWRCAMRRTVPRTAISRSAIESTPAGARSSSCCPEPCSWCALEIGIPIASSATLTSSRASCPRSFAEKSKYEPGSDVRGRRVAVGVEAEEVELDLDRGAHRLHHVAGVFEDALERRARAAFEGRPVRHHDVAHQARFGLAVLGPRQHGERRRVGTQHHVDLFAAHEPVDRAAVERHLAGECVFELVGRDRDALLHAEDIDEGEPHPAHAALLHRRERCAAGGGGILHRREHRQASSASTASAARTVS